MRKLRSAAGAACAAVAALWAGEAAAVVMTATYHGSITSMLDSGGFFGFLPNPIGADFDAVMKFDTTIGRTTTATYDQVSGSGSPSPLVSGQITINGQTFTFGTPGSVLSQNDFDQGLFDQSVDDTSGSQILFLTHGAIPASIETAFAVGAACTPALCGGDFILHNTFKDSDTFGDFTIDSVVVSRPETCPHRVCVTPGVAPEPSAWALMLAGFAGVGTAVRRRRPRPA